MTKYDVPVSSAPDSESGAMKAFSPPIHWSEKLVLVLLSVHLLYLPWALGAMHLGAQWVSLILAGVTFLLALALNPPSTTIVPKPPAWKKLATSPAFWLGTALLGYILIQGLNPAYRAVPIGAEFWMVPVDHIAWLPTGMETPFEKINAFRRLMVFGSAFLTLWTIALFLERPKSLRFLLVGLAFNGVALGILAFSQLFTGADKIFWKIPSASDEFFATFIYRNHTAAYLNILLAVSIGLYFHCRERAWKTNKRGGDKSPVFFFTSTLIFTTVVFSGSRGGAIIASILLLLAIFYTFIQGWYWNRLRETSVISTVFLGLLILFASVFTAVVGPERIVERFKELTAQGGGTSVQHRVLASRATADMFQDNWLYGWGAGSFEYAFPKYQAEYPEIHFREGRGKRPRVYMAWEFAHNDWLQYPAEYGVAGGSLFLAGLLGWAVGLVRHRALRQPLAVWLAFGVLVTLVHGLGDFVLQNPAIIVTTAAALALSYRYCTLEIARRRKRSPSPP